MWMWMWIVDVWAMCGPSVTHTAQPPQNTTSTNDNNIHELEHQPTFGLKHIE